MKHSTVKVLAKTAIVITIIGFAGFMSWWSKSNDYLWLLILVFFTNMLNFETHVMKTTCPRCKLEFNATNDDE